LEKINMNLMKDSIQILFIGDINGNADLWKEQCVNKAGNIKLHTISHIDDTKDLVIIQQGIELPDLWLEKILVCVKSNETIGTASTMLLSDLVLLNCYCNKYHDSDKETKSKIEKCCFEKDYIKVCYSLPYCIYIKAKVLTEAGIPEIDSLWNDKYLHDWFKDGLQLGWNHVICKNVLIDDCHQGESLGNKSVKKRFYDKRETELQDISNNMEFFYRLHFDNKRKVILHYLLSDFQEDAIDNIGGTQFHVRDLVSLQRYKYNVFVLARDGEFLRLTEYVDDNKLQFFFKIESKENTGLFSDINHKELYSYLLGILNVDLVHVHHTLGLPLDIFHVANNNKVSLLTTVHDFYYICPVLKKISPSGKQCDSGICDMECEKCLKNEKGINNGKLFMEKWHYENSKALKLCKKVILPSESAKNVIGQYYPEILESMIVMEHGLTVAERRKGRTRDFKNKKMKIAFIGGIGELKGGKLIYEMISKDNSGDYEWYIMGGIGYEPLYHLKKNNLYKIGWYKREEIVDILSCNDIDLICILSLVEETYCYTLSESILAGIPVLASNVGALGQRVKALNCGWLIPGVVTYGEVLRNLKIIKNNGEEYKKKVNQIDNITIKNITQMVEEYDELYGNIIKSIHMQRDLSISTLRLSECNIRDSVNDENINNTEVEIANENAGEYNAIKELNELKSSLIIRCAINIRKFNFPGKEKFKKLLIKMMR